MKGKHVGWNQKEIQGLSLRQRIYIISKSPISYPPRAMAHHQECLELRGGISEERLGVLAAVPREVSLFIGSYNLPHLSLFLYLQNGIVNKTHLLGLL